MNKCMIAAILGFAAGMYVGFVKEEELDEVYRQSKRTRKKAMRRMQKAYDNMCDCLAQD